VEHLALTKAHRQVEGEHRAAAWRIIIGHVPEVARERVVEAMQSALEAWLAYRDDVAAACGLSRPQARSSPPRASGVWTSVRPGK
jgi:pyrroloquinoline-quinone synthase